MLGNEKLRKVSTKSLIFLSIGLLFLGASIWGIIGPACGDCANEALLSALGCFLGLVFIFLAVRNTSYDRSINKIIAGYAEAQSHDVEQPESLESNSSRSLGLEENRKGLMALSAGRFEDAVKSFDRALKAFPNDGVLYSNKGIALNELKRNDDAVECYSRAIALHPGGGAPEDWNNRGKALLDLHRYEEALISFEAVIKIRGLQTLDVLGALYGKAEALAGLGMYSEAINVLDQELSLKPNLPKVVQRREEFVRLDSNATIETPGGNAHPVFNDHEFKFKKYKISGITPVSWEEMTDGRVYEVYRTDDKLKALEFLKRIPTAEIPRLFYIIVETPRGNIGKDTQGVFDEP